MCSVLIKTLRNGFICIVIHKTGQKSEHYKRHRRQKQRKNKPERFCLDAACAYFESVLEFEFGLYKFTAVLRLANLGLFVNFDKTFFRIVVFYLCAFFVKRNILFVCTYKNVFFRRRNYLFNLCDILIRKFNAAFNEQSIVFEKTYVLTLFLCRYARLDHVAYDFAVHKFYYSVAVLFGKFSVVRYDDYELIFGQLFECIQHLFSRIRI